MTRLGSSGMTAIHFANNLGEAVFRRIPKETLLSYIPYSDVCFIPTGTRIRTVFRSLKRAKGPGGTVYFSRHKPQVTIFGRSLTVAFSDHAIQRICERVAYDWPSYAELGDIYAFFDQCLEFEPCRLPDGTPAFTFFERCYPGSWRLWLAEALFGQSFDKNAEYCFRIGYCPVIIEGEFAKAKTLLFPGFFNTPEHAAIRSSTMPAEAKEALLTVAENLDVKILLDPQFTGILKLFQDLGVEQVQQRRVKYIETVG